MRAFTARRRDYVVQCGSRKSTVADRDFLEIKSWKRMGQNGLFSNSDALLNLYCNSQLLHIAPLRRSISHFKKKYTAYKSLNMLDRNLLTSTKIAKRFILPHLYFSFCSLAQSECRSFILYKKYI